MTRPLEWNQIEPLLDQLLDAAPGQRDTELDRLSAAMGHPDVDPHGDPIPGADGSVPESPGTVLTAWPLSTPARIVHLAC